MSARTVIEGSVEKHESLSSSFIRQTWMAHLWGAVHSPTKMILGTYWPSGDRCLSVVSYCRERTILAKCLNMFLGFFCKIVLFTSAVKTYHQVQDNEVLIHKLLDFFILGKGLLQSCGRNRANICFLNVQQTYLSSLVSLCINNDSKICGHK